MMFQRAFIRLFTPFFLLITALSASVLSITATPVGACSCMGPLPAADQVGSVDLAVIGSVAAAAPTTVETDDGVGGTFTQDVVDYAIKVESVIKGGEQQEITVRATPGDGGNCGVTLEVGQRLGIVGTPAEGRLSVSSCGGLVDPDELAAVKGATMPATTGKGPVASVIIGQAGPAQLVALDAEQRVLGYAGGLKGATKVAACADGATVKVLRIKYDNEGTSAAAVSTLDLSSLGVRTTEDLKLPALADNPEFPWYAAGISCNAEGNLVVFVGGAETGGVSYAATVVDGAVTRLDTGGADLIVDSNGTLFGLADTTLITIGATVNEVADLASVGTPTQLAADDGGVLIGMGELRADGTSVVTGVVPVSADGKVGTLIELGAGEWYPLSAMSGAIVANDGLTGATLAVTADGPVDLGQGSPMGSVGKGKFVVSGFEGPPTVVGQGGTTKLDGIARVDSVVTVNPTTEVSPDSPGAQPVRYDQDLSIAAPAPRATTDTTSSRTALFVALGAAVAALAAAAWWLNRRSRRVADLPQA